MKSLLLVTVLFLQLFNLSAHASESSDQLYVLHQKLEQLEALFQESYHWAAEEDMPKIMAKYHHRSQLLQQAIHKLEKERETLLDVTLKINRPSPVLTNLKRL